MQVNRPYLSRVSVCFSPNHIVYCVVLGLPVCHERDVSLMLHNMYGQISRSLEELHVSGVCFTLLECTIYTTITEKSLLPQQLRGDRSRRWCRVGGTHDDCTGDCRMPLQASSEQPRVYVSNLQSKTNLSSQDIEKYGFLPFVGTPPLRGIDCRLRGR